MSSAPTPLLADIRQLHTLLKANYDASSTDTTYRVAMHLMDSILHQAEHDILLHSKLDTLTAQVNDLVVRTTSTPALPCLSPTPYTIAVIILALIYVSIIMYFHNMPHFVSGLFYVTLAVVCISL